MLNRCFKRTITSISELQRSINNTCISKSWLNQCIETSKQLESQNQSLKPIGDLLGKWFEKYIYFTGETQQIKQPIYNPTINELESIANILIKSGNLATHSKVIQSQLLIFKSNGNWGKVNELRYNSRLNKFKLYHDKLGALMVIENGMFNKFTFSRNTKYSLNEFEFLCESLALTLKSNDQILTLTYMIYLIEQMHGFHIKEYHERYHKGLSPNIQMARIYRCSINRSSEPDSIKLNEYNELIRNTNKSQSHENKPVKMSSGQRNQKIGTDIQFGRLPMNIILKVISIQLQSGIYKGEKLSHELAFRMIATMIKKRKVNPNQDTLNCLIRIFHYNEDPSLRTNIPILLLNFKRYCSLNDSVFKTLNDLGYDNNGGRRTL